MYKVGDVLISNNTLDIGLVFNSEELLILKPIGIDNKFYKYDLPDKLEWHVKANIGGNGYVSMLNKWVDISLQGICALKDL